MEIEFVNHASFITRSGAVSMICDPWLEGTAFNDGWALISPTAFRYEDFSRVTHIWFSHEHPDHFAPANLRKIPEALRRNITVLYQETRDRKVAKYCEKQGFAAVKELPLSRWVEIAPDFNVICGPATHGDSWLAVRSGGRTVLNLNDCFVLTEETASPIRDLVGGPIDLLATQFSLSAWEGNPEEVERRRGGAKTMLDRCIFHAQFFAPQYVLPFASYVWFCHEENFYVNAQHNRIDLVVEALRERSEAEPIVMYPGDRFEIDQPFDSQPAIDRYVAEFDQLPSRQRVAAKRYSETELAEAAEKFRAAMTDRASRARLDVGLARVNAERALERLKRDRGPLIGARSMVDDTLDLARSVLTLRPRPVRIYLWDRDQAYLFDLTHGLRQTHLSEAQCDVRLGTDSLIYAFKFLWGGESLQVNARFSEVYPNGRAPLFDYFHLAESFNRGETLNWQTVAKRVARTVLAR